MNIKSFIITNPTSLTEDFYLKVYISFDNNAFIPKEKFEWIEEWHAGPEQELPYWSIAFLRIKEFKMVEGR